jgi:serine/threonine-protein kinase
MNSPTITSPAMMTGVGMILGTAAYMSPEQARGQNIDKRSDVWAFGCVLYEMLTGRRVFAGDNVSDTIAAVLRGEPDWSVLPANVPPAIQALVRRCLQKDRLRRIADLSTASFLLSEPVLVVTPRSTSTSAVSYRSLIQRVFLVAVLSLMTGGLIAGATALWWARRTVTTDIVRFVIPVPAAQRFTNLGRQIVAISPDGRQLIYAANEQLYLRSTGDLEAKPIAGSAASGGVNNPVFSPDGKWLAFYSLPDRAIKRIAVIGGAAVTLAAADNPFGVSWGTQGILFGQGGFGQGGKGIMRVSEAGGKPDVIVRLSGDEVPYGPQMLPGGDWVLVSVAATGSDPERWNRGRILAYSPTSGERKVLIEGGSDARYVRTGHLRVHSALGCGWNC